MKLHVVERGKKYKLSKPQAELLFQLYAARTPLPHVEYQFHDTSKWRFDIAWPGLMLAVECDGGTWTNGRHTRGKGYQEDCKKGNAAIEAGWRVLHYTTDQIKSGEALSQIERILRGE